MAAIRVLLVDDHQLVRQGVRNLLEQEESVTVVGEAANADEAIAQIEAVHPDVVLLDISMPGVDGLQLTSLIRANFPAVHVLILTMHSEEEYMRATLLAGADGYILKHASLDELLDGIRLVYNDHLLFPRMARGLIEETSPENGGSARQSGGLTGREKEILSHLAMGRTSREIAEEVFLSAKTVDNYRARILSKLQARNVAEAIASAMQQGIIPLGREVGSLPLGREVGSLQFDSI